MDNQPLRGQMRRGTVGVGVLAAVFAVVALAYTMLVPAGSIDWHVTTLFSLFAVIALAVFCVLAWHDAHTGTAAAEPQGVRPPRWVVLGLCFIVPEEVPGNSAADQLLHLESGRGRFMTRLCGFVEPVTGGHITIDIDSRLTDEDTGLYAFQTTDGRFWVLIAQDVMSKLEALDPRVTSVRAQLLVCNRQAPPN